MAALGFSLAQVQRHRIKSISFRDSLPSIAAGCVGYCLMLLVYRAGGIDYRSGCIIIKFWSFPLETVESKQCLVYSIKHSSTIEYQHDHSTG